MKDLDPSKLLALPGKVAIVTGASSGLGERFALLLEAAGATVVAVARRRDRLEDLAARSGGGIVPHAVDLADPDQIERLVGSVLADNGRVDIVVNNAGTGDDPTTAGALSTPADDFDRVLGVNLRAAYLLSRHAGKAMCEAGGGSIVNVSSVLGLRGSEVIDQPAYSASKGGLISLTRALAGRLGRDGVRVNAIAPGWFPTDLSRELFADERALRWVVRRTPLGRTGGEGDLDGALLLLAGDAGSFITGQVLAVDGGWSAV